MANLKTVKECSRRYRPNNAPEMTNDGKIKIEYTTNVS
jgi:hypothetical protein